LQLKNKLLGEAFSVLFFGSCMRMRKGWKKFLGLVLLFLLLSSVDTGVFFFEEVSWVRFVVVRCF